MISKKVTRPFSFGPIEFEGLQMDNTDFNLEEVNEKIIEFLEDVSLIGKYQYCIHGYAIKIKGRTLKRASTILKHSRFATNLQVQPVFPVQVVIPEGMDEQEED